MAQFHVLRVVQRDVLELLAAAQHREHAASRDLVLPKMSIV